MSPATHLGEVILARLAAAPEGLSEYELIKALESDGRLPDLDLRSSLGLFRAHFLLFHHLHRLRLELLERRAGDLVIAPLCIRLDPYRPGEPALTAVDRLAEYYLDPGPLERTTEAEVQALLDGFYRVLHARDRREQALAELGLSDPVDLPNARRRYRRLAMTHHPDRGGDGERFKRLNAAIALLEASRL